MRAEMLRTLQQQFRLARRRMPIMAKRAPGACGSRPPGTAGPGCGAGRSHAQRAPASGRDPLAEVGVAQERTNVSHTIFINCPIFSCNLSRRIS